MTGRVLVSGDIKNLWAAHVRECRVHNAPVCKCNACFRRAEANLVRPFDVQTGVVADHTLVVGAGPFCPDVVRAAADLFAHGKMGPHLTFVGGGVVRLHPLWERFADLYEGYAESPFEGEREAEYMARLFPTLLGAYPQVKPEARVEISLPDGAAGLSWDPSLTPELCRTLLPTQAKPVVLGIVAMPQVMLRAVDILLPKLAGGKAGLVTHLAWPEMAGCSRQNWQYVPWARDLFIRENNRIMSSGFFAKRRYRRTVSAVRQMNGVPSQLDTHLACFLSKARLRKIVI